MTRQIPDDELLARYAQDEAGLTASERAQVEAWLATAETDDATVAEVRTHAPRATAPDWQVLAERIEQATTRAPRRRWPWAIGGLGLMAAAAALAIVVARPSQMPLAPTMAALTTGPDRAAPETPADDLTADDLTVDDLTADDLTADDDLAGDDLAAADDSDLGGMGAIDDALVDEVLALDDERPDDDLPAVGATWTEWIDDYTELELERALAWLDSEEAG